MILHKEINREYIPFAKAIRDITFEEKEAPEISVFRYGPKKEEGNLLEKYSHMLQNLVTFERETDDIKNPRLLVEKLTLAVRRVIPLKDASLLYFDDTFSKLLPVDKRKNTQLVELINQYYKEGILTVLFERGKPIVAPELKSYNSEGPKLNFVLFPIIEEGKKKGLFALLSAIPQEKFSELDKQIIKILLNVSLSKIDKYAFKERLFNTYEELQTYQAKLSNDFRLAAIGELTEGIVEDISTPLQVIMSTVDMLDNNESYDEIKTIKSQVHKINTVINRLVKFASINQKDIIISPVKLNDLVVQYYKLVKSTLDNADLECVLDFEENLPSLLSHPNYIFQLLTNTLGLIKGKNGKGGGIIIQTRLKGDFVILKVITTAELKTSVFENKKLSSGKDLNIRIIENLMNKHEGSFTIQPLNNSGSIITMTFPLKRRIRE